MHLGVLSACRAVRNFHGETLDYDIAHSCKPVWAYLESTPGSPCLLKDGTPKRRIWKEKGQGVLCEAQEFTTGPVRQSPRSPVLSISQNLVPTMYVNKGDKTNTS
jgi:hypothetical protein